MSETYRFRINEAIGIVADVLQRFVTPEEFGVNAERVVQAAVEQFGVEFTKPINRSPEEFLHRIPYMDATLAARVEYDLMHGLRQMLPWTEGPPPDDERLVGTLRNNMLSVMTAEREKLPTESDPGEGYIPRRYRESIGFT